MTPEGGVESTSDGRVLVAGEVDAANVARIRAAVLARFEGPAGSSSQDGDAGAVLLDLRSVEFMASAGLAMLLDLEARATVAGRQLVVVVVAGGAVVRQLVRTGLDTQLTVRHVDAEE